MPGSVKVYVDVAGSDGIPHVFVGITDSLGATTYVGYQPLGSETNSFYISRLML